MASQYNEHVRILERVGNLGGRFLDVGAFDGKTFSNTSYLAEAGWHGVLVEPNPIAFGWLLRNYIDYGTPDRFDLVNAAVVAHVSNPAKRLRRFHANTADAIAADAMSTLVEGHREKFPRHPFIKIRIPVITWAELLDGVYCSGFDFVNIDVEGLNMELLESAPWDRLKPQCVCVELDPESALGDMTAILRDCANLTGFEKIGGNLIAWR